MNIVGIDPGMGGAIAFIRPGNDVVIEDMPVIAIASGAVRRRVDGYALKTLLLRHCPAVEPVRVFCEDISIAMGGKGKTSAATIISLARTLGAIEGVTDALRFPMQLVAPKTWQGFYGLKGKAAEGRECKASGVKGELPKAMLLARSLYPQAIPMLARVKDADRAEALLIAHYGKRTIE